MVRISRGERFLAALSWLAMLPMIVRGGDDASELAAARKRDRDQFGRIASAVIEYHAQKFQTPPAAVVGSDGKPLLSWRVLILPHLGEAELYKQFRLYEAWDSAHNKALLEKMPAVYAPARGKAKDPFVTYYQAFVGGGSGFEQKRGIAQGMYRDGLAITIMLAEAAEPAPWSKPVDLEFDPAKELPKLGGAFPDGFHVAMFNGDVHFFRRDFDKTEMRNVITRDGGEIVHFGKLKK